MPTKISSLMAQGCALEVSRETFGELRTCAHAVTDTMTLRERMRLDGYLYLPGLLNREEVLDARRVVTDRLWSAGHLNSDYASMDAVARPGANLSFMPELANNNPELFDLLYAGPMMDFFVRFLGSKVLHYDFTWFRAVAPGIGSPPHCDAPYMGRGTHNLYTAWTPIGDVDFEQGGLMILESSTKHAGYLSNYLNKDVDSYCLNGPYAEDVESGRRKWGEFDGVLSKDPNKLRETLGGRWLTTEFSAGDVLVFSVYTIHMSLDNRSSHIRLSSDSRYQAAEDPVDERWVGENPVGHGVAGKRGRVC
jgi:hypothetical protein